MINIHGYLIILYPYYIVSFIIIVAYLISYVDRRSFSVFIPVPHVHYTFTRFRTAGGNRPSSLLF